MLGCLEIGGAEQQAFLLARFLKEKCGAYVEIWGVAHGGKLTSKCDKFGIPWRILGNPLSGTFVSTVVKLLGISWSFRRANADIVLPYTLVPNVISGITWRLGGAKLCVWNQRDEGTEGHREPFERWAVRLTPMFFANSRAGADYVIGSLCVDSQKVTVVHNGIALEKPQETRSVCRQQLGISDSSVCVAMIANLSDKKDHVTLINAWSKVLKELLPAAGRLKLLLAGRYDNASRNIIELVGVLKISEYVTFLGPVDDIAGLLQAVDIGVYSSISEGLPNGVIECMAAGKAIVASDIPGIREAVGDGYTLLSKPRDSDEMASHLITLINNPILRKDIGLRNMERALALFDTVTMCNKITEKLNGYLMYS
ncbi:MAG: glycosyltransferase family 4 protein [Desulfuromonadaceae bacterium]|nr:glycosyltransferase family 4 protein [Desulfuromonadaceae bacterium]MDD2854108.1 glycosyltransferase family 4 protein [Desulfuromonadaceae bacterium]